MMTFRQTIAALALSFAVPGITLAQSAPDDFSFAQSTLEEQPPAEASPSGNNATDLVGQIRQLRGQARVAERETHSLAARIRGVDPDDWQDSAKSYDEAKRELHDKVQHAYDLRRELHLLECRQLRERADRIEASIERRHRDAPSIVNRRVDDLINPELKWDAADPRPVTRFRTPDAQSSSTIPGDVNPNVPQPNGYEPVWFTGMQSSGFDLWVRGQTKSTANLVLRVGAWEDRPPLEWTTPVQAGEFLATVDITEHLKLDNGREGAGIVLTVDQIDGPKSKSFLHISEDSHVLPGTFQFRKRGELAQNRSTLVFGDIVRSDGSRTPVSLVMAESDAEPVSISSGMPPTSMPDGTRAALKTLNDFLKFCREEKYEEAAALTEFSADKVSDMKAAADIGDCHITETIGAGKDVIAISSDVRFRDTKEGIRLLFTLSGTVITDIDVENSESLDKERNRFREKHPHAPVFVLSADGQYIRWVPENRQSPTTPRRRTRR